MCVFMYVSYCRPHFPEHVIAMDQEKPKFIDLEGIGMLLDTLSKNLSEHSCILCNTQAGGILPDMYTQA